MDYSTFLIYSASEEPFGASHSSEQAASWATSSQSPRDVLPRSLIPDFNFDHQMLLPYDFIPDFKLSGG